MASEYQIMAMINDLNRQVHDHEALSRQADNKAKTATGQQQQELKDKANSHRKDAENLKKDIEALKKRLEEQKQAKSTQIEKSTQIQKYGEVGREAASKKAAEIRQLQQIPNKNDRTQ